MVTTPEDARRPAQAPPPETAAAERPRASAAAGVCRPAQDETACPACGATMHLWANYYRCRACGFKESCCF